ncbi:Cytokinin dehydrogenase [Stylosanthes scabra]|uniref:cytokinin dehydrogenase n=1 Tax=Stylosanthes scabra TaxID=79078 RepID=A0ABU6QBH8_9FABA|nr:Cytokinin dehydrogenase [Stylosanthes scabra]
MAETFPFSIYFILLLIITTVGKTERLLNYATNLRLAEELFSVENISDKLYNDTESLWRASRDFGNIVHEVPTMVFHPSSVDDIANLIKLSYSSPVPFTVATRGQGHSTGGQAMAREGVVVDMAALRRERKKKGIGGINVGVSGEYVDVGGEELWIDVLNETLENGVAPVSWTDYLYLSVGGTLSNAGISGQSFRHGPQISNVLEMDVVTGKGDLITCSKQKNSELFHAVLGGLGQFGVITRARISLQPAPTRVKWIRLLYSDFSAFTKDQERLISINGWKQNKVLDYLEGTLLMHQGPINNWRSSFFPLSDHLRIASLISKHNILYCLELSKNYDHQSQESVNKEIEELLEGMGNIPGFYYEKDVSYFEFLNRVRGGELKLQSQGLWEVPHPWLNLFIPKSKIMQFNSGVFRDILFKRNITTGPVLVYPMNRSKWDDRMSASIPDEDVFYTVGFLHSSGFDNWNEFDAQNKEILKFCIDNGIKVKQYLAQHSTQEEWKNHFGANKWKVLVERKNQFDPRMILSPGQKIFNNNKDSV